MNLAGLVGYWGGVRADQQAIVYGNTSQSWSEVDRVTDALALGLAARGVRKGDRVGVMMLNRPELAHVILATLKLGAISVPLNFRLLGTELAPLVIDCAPRVVIVENELAPLLEPATRDADFEIFALGGTDHRPYDSLLVEGRLPSADISPHDPALICYTSGTTGLQKGALLTHRSILAPGLAQVLSHGISSLDRVMCAAPLVYTGSVCSVFLQLAVLPGATMVLLRDFDPQIALDTFEREHVTAATTVPVIWERIAQIPDFTSRRLANFTFAGVGGAPVGPDLVDFYNAHRVRLTQTYGLTEASGMVTTLSYDEARTRRGFAGRALVGTEVRVASMDGEFAAPHEVGEIIVRGEHVMREYWRNPEATAATLSAGWLRTGDLGMQDEDGFLKVVDRRKDMLISGGLNVYPAEIEKALHGIPGLTDFAVIGVRDDRWGEAPMVVVHSDRPIEDLVADIAAAGGANLARYKRPRHVLALDEALPRTFSGKLAKAVLRQRFTEAPEDAISLQPTSTSRWLG
jgi:fatty-acyl-CoA synthase